MYNVPYKKRKVYSEFLTHNQHNTTKTKLATVYNTFSCKFYKNSTCIYQLISRDESEFTQLRFDQNAQAINQGTRLLLGYR